MEQCVKNLVFIGRAMHLNPELCFATDDGAAVDADAGGEDHAQGDDGASDADEMEAEAGDDQSEEDDSEDSDAAAAPAGSSSGGTPIADAPATDDPLRWVFNRMSHMVVHKGEARRRAVFSWFLAMAAVHEPAVSAAHLKLMLAPLRRAVLDAEAGGVEHKASGVAADGGGGAGAGRAAAAKPEQTSAELATEVSGLAMSTITRRSFSRATEAVRPRADSRRCLSWFDVHLSPRPSVCIFSWFFGNLPVSRCCIK